MPAVCRGARMSGMSTRVLITIDESADTDAVVSALRALGPESVRAPAQELPGVAIADVADDQVESFLAEASSLEGVAVAEPDVLRYTEPVPPSRDRGHPVEDQGAAPEAGWPTTPDEQPQ